VIKKTALRAGLTAAALALSSAVLADEVEFANWTITEDSGKALMEALAEGFAEESEHTVKQLGYAWKDMNKNLFLRSRTNTLPDTAQIQGRFLPTIANIDGIQDLDAVFGKENLEAMFPAAFLAAGQVKGKQVALPWIGGTIGMVANKKVLAAAGVDEIPTTMDAFMAAMQKVQDTVPNSVPYGMATKNNSSILLDYLIWAWTHGADVIGEDGMPDVNSAEGVAALQFMVGLMDKRFSAPEIDRPDARRLFGQEATAFYFDAPSAKNFAADFSGQGPDYVVNLQPMRTPVVNAGDSPASIQWGHVLVMFNADNAEPDSAAAQFLTYTLSDAALIDYALTKGALPTTTSGQASDKVQSDPYLASWASEAVAPRPNPIAPLSNGAAVSDIIGEEVQAALLKQKTAEEAANDMQKRLEEALADAG